VFEDYLVIPYFLVIQDRISCQGNLPEEINRELQAKDLKYFRTDRCVMLFHHIVEKSALLLIFN
jgi:hypothetical protein